MARGENKMKILLNENQNLKSDLINVVLSNALLEKINGDIFSVTGKQTVAGNEVESKIVSIGTTNGKDEFLDINQDLLNEAQIDTITQFLLVRLAIGQISVNEILEDNGEAMYNEDFVASSFKSTVLKSCRNDKEVNDYISSVIAEINLSSSDDLIENTISMPRIDSQGSLVVDVITTDLSKADYNALVTEGKLYKASVNMKRFRNEVANPFNRAVSRFGNETARVGASIVGETAGNVLATVANASTEGVTAFLHGAARDLKVGTIAADGRLSSAVENTKEEGKLFVSAVKGAFGVGKKAKRQKIKGII